MKGFWHLTVDCSLVGRSTVKIDIPGLQRETVCARYIGERCISVNRLYVISPDCSIAQLWDICDNSQFVALQL